MQSSSNHIMNGLCLLWIVNLEICVISQSAVASPEVKQHLKEFVSRRKKEDATSVASTGNLKAASAGPANGQPPPQPILRKTASESNLLKVDRDDSKKYDSTNKLG